MNSFWWAAICTPFADFLSDQDVRRWTPEECHIFLKCKILGDQPVIDPKTGEVIGHQLPDTHTMEIEAFSDLIERAIAYLADEYGVIVLDPDQFAQPTERRSSCNR